MSNSLRLSSSAFRVRLARFFVLLLLLLFAGEFGRVQAAGITLVQHIGKDAGSTTTSTLSFASANTAGNFIAVAIRGGFSSSQVFTVTDSNGNTYKKAAQVGYTGSAVTSAIYYAENIKGGANTVTVSMTVSGPLRFDLLEYAGVATSNSLDVTAVGTSNSSAPATASVNTTVNGDLLLGTLGTTNTATFTAGAGYTIEDFVPVEPNTKHIGEDQIQTTAGAASVGASLAASDSWGAVLAAFKPAGGVAGVPTSITSTAGTSQSATVGTAFAIQLQATVKDSFNNPVSGATVTFTVPGSVASGTFAGGVNTATTNASGVATAAVFTANNTAGSYTVTASVSGVTTPANFSLANLAGAAASITATAGTPQSATVNTAFATQLQATVKDSFNNPVGGVTVTFAAPASGASGNFAGGVTTATTNASGVATAPVFTANTTAGGPYTVTATVSGAATAANFSLTNLAGAASSVAATAGTPQSAAINTAFATQLQATVTDSFSNPLSGATVTFTAPASGASGTFAGGVKTATTNAQGIATAPVFTANSTAGAYTVTAAVSGVATPANFSLTNLAGTAASITATSGTPQSTAISTAFATQLQATVKDSGGNPVSGVTVTFAAPTSGASGTFAGGVNTTTTNASGVATAPVFTANGTTGSYTVTTSVSGVASPANFSLTNLGNPPASIVATAGTPQSATINTAFAAQLRVTVTDSGNNPVSGVTVAFTAPGSGATGTFAGGVNTGVTNASGVATSAVFTANSVAGSYTVSAAVSGVASPANFSLTNLTGAAASVTATAGTPQSATVGAAYATQFQATVKDAGGNPVNGVTVTFAASGSGASGTFAGGVNTATTNSSGIAMAAAFTANNTAGTYTVTASVTGVVSPANFSVTNFAGAPSSIAATAGTPQSANINTAFAIQLQATVTDSFNNPVNGVTVAFTAPASGASGSFAGGVNTATTNASGIATATVFTANSVAGGPYTVTGSVSGVANPANFSLTNTASAPAPITLVQHIGKDAGTATTSTLAFTSGNTAGNFIAVAVRGGNSSSQVISVSDSTGNVYKQAALVGYTGSAVTSAIYYAENIKGGANTITVTISVSGPLRFDILEYSGVATSGSLDVTAIGTATSTSPLTASVNTTANGDLLLGTVGTTNTATFTAGTGYAIRDFVPAEPNTKHIGEDQIQSAAGAATAGATLAASDSWGAILAAFKPATGTGGAGVPASITASAGTPQSATVSTAFATQLQATVKDSLNNPVSGVSVTFAAPASGASGAFAGGVTTATTNSAGVATAAVFTANGVAGTYTVTASVSGVSTPANFSLTNLAGAAASVAATAGTPQSATINAAFATQLQATVKDSGGNPVSGVSVTFAAPTSGASGTFAGGVNTATTNASGVATAPVFTANGTTGSYTVTTSVSGVAAPANFSLTNVAAPPASITASAGTPQSATVNTAFTSAFQATVKDASNNPVSGVTVTFTAPGSGASGTFAGGVNTATTNSLGIATAAVFTANGIAGGPYTVTATVSGLATPANFSLTNLAGAAASIAATAGTPQSATINTAFSTQLQATVTDSLNNPVSGATVTFTAPASGASGTFAGGVNTATTNAQGVATAPVFTANGTSGGPYIVTASVSGVATAANFSLTNLVSAPPIALVQHTSIDAGTTTTGSLAFTTNNTSGNWIAVAIRGGSSSSQVFTVSDSNVNTYKQGGQIGFSGSAITLAIYYAENIKGGANTVTVSMTASGPLRFAILEYSGVATASSLDGTPAVATGASSSPNSGNLTTTANGDLLLGAIASTNSGTFTAGTGYAIRDFVPAEPNTKLISEDQIQSAGGVASASASLAASDNWGAILAAFKPAVLVAGSPANITATAGTPQSTTVGTAFATQLQATVKDSFNNPVSGVTVTFTAPASGASGTFAGGVTTATTNSLGVATAAVFTANNTAGAYTVAASVSGVATPANFSLTNLAGPAASITATAGTPQNATINAAFATNLQATVKDSLGNPVSGVTVTFAAPASGASGTFAGGVSTATTNASGVATAPVFTANNTIGGPYTVTASVSGVATAANFSLSNTAAPPASITATGGTPQSAAVNTAFATALQATVKDSSNNPVSGVTVTFTAPASGASGTFAGGVTTATTNSLGVATAAAFTANSIAGGPYTVTATVSGVATPANFSLTNLAGPPATISATGGTPQSAVINTAFGAQLQATVKDSLSNPVSGVTVTFAAPSSGASGSFAGGVNTATTNAQGVATAPVFTANGTTGGPYTVTASVSGVATPANFSLTNLSTASAITLVQHTSIDAGTVTTASLAFKSNNTAGNWIAVAIRAGNSSSQNFTVGDSNGNSYRQAYILGLNANAVTFALYYAENIKAGANTITVSDNVSGPFRLAILEYAGIAQSSSLDATPVTAQGSGTSPNSGSLTPLSNGDLLLATVVTQNAATYTAGTGYTIEEFVPAEPNTKLIAEDRIQSTAASVSAGATIAASDNWGAGLAAFRAAGVAPPPFTVTVSPTSASLATGYGTQNFTASVVNDFQHLGVTWSLSGAGCSGSTCGTLTNVATSSVTYTAPLNVPSPATVILTATSLANSTSTASATITVTQGVLNVAISPKRAAITTSQTEQFTVNVYNDPSNSGATLQVDGNTGGNPTTGTISSTGLYTPGTQAGLHTIAAISNANASVTATATVAVTDLAGVLTHHNDIQRTGQNLQEYALTTSNVNSSTFSLLFSCPVDGYMFAAPLYVANLNVGGQTRNVVFITTSHDSVYAFDADSPACVQLWKTSFLSTGVTTVPLADVNDTAGDMFPEIGATSTPVIDPSTNTIYVEAKTKDTVSSGCSTSTPCYFHYLHALDLVTGSEKFGGPILITASGFNALIHHQRPALLLNNGTVYVGFGSHGDRGTYQGWLFGYDAATLAQKFVTPLTNVAGNQGAVWLSGGGPAADSSGNVYISTGNGIYDGTKNFGDTAVKLSPTGGIPPVDWFTPFNQSTFNANDIDLGSSNIILLPPSVGSAAHPNLAIATGKVAILYLLDVGTPPPGGTTMGKFNSSSNNDVQEVTPVPPPNTTMFNGGNYAYPAYWNGNIYSTGQNFPLSQFKIANGVIATPQFAKSSNTFPPRGAVPVVSASGTTNGIVWIIDYTGWQFANTPAILDAYDANNVGTLLYSSPANGTGAAVPAVKFTLPVVANGKVYVGGQDGFSVFGLLPN